MAQGLAGCARGVRVRLLLSWSSEHLEYVMQEGPGLDGDGEPLRRVDVEILIIHPTMTPADITAALALEAKVTHCVGDERRTPRGTLLEGSYRDTRWRHSVRYELRNQWFADKITTLVDRLMPHKEFLRQLRATGGKATIIIQLLGDGYVGTMCRRTRWRRWPSCNWISALSAFARPNHDRKLNIRFGGA
jgi:hypothetical protein